MVLVTGEVEPSRTSGLKVGNPERVPIGSVQPERFLGKAQLTALSKDRDPLSQISTVPRFESIVSQQVMG